MNKLDAFLTENASTKRFLTMIVTVAVLTLNKKLGLGLDVESEAMITSIVVAFLIGSNMKEAAVVKAEAAGTKAAENVKTVDEADTILRGAKGPLP